MKNREAIIIIIAIISLIIVSLMFGIVYLRKNIETENIQETKKEENKIIKLHKNQSTIEIPELTLTDEENLEYQETEDEGFELQGEIAYNGTNEYPKISLGEYPGITYYSQIDTRWKDVLYTSTKNETQTIGNSGCGPACGAMIVSSIRGNINPQEMSDLYVKYGFRSAKNGTYWSAFRWTADVFDIDYKETYKLNDVIDLVKDNWMVIASCGNGLFTTGGHFVIIYGIEGNTLKIFDPYLYRGKFNTATRRGKVTAEGNTVYCSIENFREYANYSGFFCFKNDRKDTKENTDTIAEIDTNKVFSSYTVKVSPKVGLNARAGAGINYAKRNLYVYGKILTIVAESNGWGKTSDGYWVSLQYTSKIDSNIKNTVGKVKTLKNYTTLYSEANLTGTKYQYLANTTVVILENVSPDVDKVRVIQTGRIAYVRTSAYK